MKIINNKNLYIYSLIYLLGVFHWIFFFYFVDYYEYNNENIYDEVKIINEKANLVGVSINKLGMLYLDQDKALIKSIIEEPDLKKSFKYKKFNYSDWKSELEAYEVFKYSLNNKIMPYHSTYGVGNNPKLNRWLGSPIISISPQIFLLNFLDTQTFCFINLLLMFTIGYIGCLFFKRKFKLGYLSFIFLFLIYNFNGYFVEKISAYGPHMMGYFLLPFFLYFLFQASDSKHISLKNKVSIGILIGITNSLILLQGSIHIYSICVTFFVLWAIFNYRLYILSLTALISNFALSAIKILPGYLAYGRLENHRYWEAGGYGNLSSFFEGFVVSKTPLNFPEFSSHEFSLYIGFFGTFFLIFFGIIYPFMKDQNSQFNYWSKFGMPIAIMIFISFRHFKHLIIPQWIPLLNSESITTRYMIIPLLVTLFIAVINLQNFIDKGLSNFKTKVTIYSLISIIFYSLINHSRHWRMHLVENEILWYEKLLSITHVQSKRPLVENNYNDSLYIFSFWSGSTVTIISLLVMLYWFLRQKNKY